MGERTHDWSFTSGTVGRTSCRSDHQSASTRRAGAVTVKVGPFGPATPAAVAPSGPSKRAAPAHAALRELAERAATAAHPAVLAELTYRPLRRLGT